MNLIESVSAEVEKANHSIILLPAGSLEQHGTEAPLGCDGIIAEALCQKAGMITATPVLPTLFYGFSYCHTSFPGTFSISENTYSALLLDIISEAARNEFKQILILSGHGGNRSCAEKAIHNAKCSISSKYTGYWQLPGVQEEEDRLFRRSGYHITAAEISMVWYLLSGSIPGVFTDLYPAAPANISSLSPDQWRRAFPDGGVGSDLSDVSLSKGQILFDFITESLAAVIRELK